MTLLMLTVLCFGAGASITRLVTRDGLLDTLRERWEDHFTARMDVVLREAERILPGDSTYSSPELRRDQKRKGLLVAVGDRSEDEAKNLAWRKRTGWTAMSYRLIRLRGYRDFISCPWCVSPYVYAVVCVGGWAALGFPFLVGGLPIWFVLPAAVLAFRWAYALLATHLPNP